MAEAKRRLAAILAADVAGYSRLMGADEERTIAALNDRRAIFRASIEAHHGRVVDTAGDSVLATFDSVVEAVRSASEVQAAIAARNRDLPEDRQMAFRIGVNSGDVVEQDDGTIYGDGVNIAARLEALAEPGGIVVSEDAFRNVRNRTDFGFEDLGEHTVKNIADPVRAYRLTPSDGASTPPPLARAKSRRLLAGIGAITLIAAALVAWQSVTMIERGREIRAQKAETETDSVLALPTGPSIAVLPLENLSGDPEQDYFVDGITEEIITELTRFPDLFVIARNSTFQYQGKSIDVRQIGKELGAQYILEGSVRRAVNTIRVTAQLIDAANGNHLWADTYERELTAENIFGVQDEITNHIVARIADPSGGIISQTRIQEARRKPAASLNAYDCVLQARAYLNVITPQKHLAARACLERTVAADKDYGAAWTWLAQIYLGEYLFGFNSRPEDAPALERALQAAERAVSLDAFAPEARHVLGAIYFHTDQIERFVGEAEEVLRLNPNNATIIADIGNYLNNIGEGERGLALVRKSIALNPNYPGWINVTIFNDHYWHGRYAEALAAVLKWNNPEFYWWHANTAAAYGQLGRFEDAKQHIAILLELNPEFPERAREELRIWIKVDGLVEHLIEGMRKAGLDIPDETVASD